jgi:hypothetical protein
MASLPTYVAALWERQQIIAVKLGSDISQAAKETRVLNRALLVLLATLIKTLVDKGVVTDAELIATLNTARDAAYDDEPVWTPKPPPSTP